MTHSEFQWPRDTGEHVALTGRISQWLLRLGVSDGERRATLAVGLADTLAAAKHVADHLEALLRQDLETDTGAEQALTDAVGIEQWLFNELKDHVLEMEPLWEPEIVERVGARLPSPDLNDEDGTPAG